MVILASFVSSFDKRAELREPMIIALHELSDAQVSYPIEDDGWFPHDEIKINTMIDGYITIKKMGDDAAWVSGRLSFVSHAPCDKCAELTEIALSADFVYECFVGPEEIDTRLEAECQEENYNKIYLEKPVINTGDLLREQVFLAMPIRRLCRPSCQGICPGCGTDLNSGTCICENTDDASPFAILKQVKGK